MDKCREIGRMLGGMINKPEAFCRNAHGAKRKEHSAKRKEHSAERKEQKA
jgi:hypothetical protein